MDVTHLIPQVLLIERSTLARRNLAAFIQQEGFEPVIPEDFQQGAQLVTMREPQLVLLDAEATQEEMTLLLDAMRSSHRTVMTPIILMVGQNAHPPMDLFQFHTVTRIDKPIVTEKLLATMRELLSPLPPEGRAVTLSLDEQVFHGKTKLIQGRTLTIEMDGGNSLYHLGPGTSIGFQFQTADRSLILYEAAISEQNGPEFTVIELGTMRRRIQQRQFIRKTLCVRVRYKLPNDFYRLAMSLDLSLGGMRITQVHGSAQEGTPITLSLIVSENHFIGELNGTLRRVSGSGKAIEWGIQFTEISGELQDQILMLLFGHLQEVSLVTA